MMKANESVNRDPSFKASDACIYIIIYILVYTYYIHIIYIGLKFEHVY